MNSELYFEKVDILVNRLKEYLLSKPLSETILLLKEREGWVEYQELEWLGREIQERYNWSVWEISAIDVMAILIAKIRTLINDEHRI